MNAAQACEARAADYVRENGFGLIVRSVRNGDARGAAFGDDAVEKSVAQLARHVFEVAALAGGFGSNVFARCDEFESVRLGEVCDEFGVTIGFRAAQRVIEVRYHERDSEIITQTQEEAQ